MNRDTSCKERIKAEYADTMKTVRKLWALYQFDSEVSDEELGRWSEYGLGFDYVPPKTFEGQRRGYFRYQLSWGGPSDEFRFYTDENLEPTRIEYWFMDWFDAAKKILKGDDDSLLREIFDYFKDMGVVDHAYQTATE